MTYFRHDSAQAPYQPSPVPQANPDVAYAVDDDGDRVYTEADYGVAPDGDAFLPDETDDSRYAPPFSYAGSYETEDGALLDDDLALTDDELLDEDLLTDEERQELRRSTWQLIAGLSDVAGIILGTAAILVLIALLVSLLNWLADDISQTFTLWQHRI
ncbi:MAG: hypothetical protein ACI4MG_12050 [Aristaeellaceae bacterium]